MAAHQGTSRTSRWIRRFHPSDESRVRLVCLPHAGGSAPFYFPMSRALAPAVDVLTVQYPGRLDRQDEPLIEDMGTYADTLVAELRPWLDRPTAFFGHSMGAVLGFEVIRRLERDPAPGAGRPVRLFASGRRAPSCLRDDAVHRRDDDGIVAEMRALSGTDSRVLGDEELLRMVLPAIRADYIAVETYRAGADATIRTPVTVLTGDNDPRTRLDEAQAWHAHTTGGFDIHIFAGGHFFLTDHQEEIVKVVLGELSALG
ncbi:thioesterase II family protein [Streptomyces sp. URMC 123]|uniref:thioesterase II family protein n=1 Tax=Streptomyces sp. URMC 123 TaxID=3423403 RepID=UPI003F1CD558